MKTSSPDAPISTLSGGNVQRAVLARELSGEVDVLVAANPVFGLDFAAVADIHAQIMAARNRGAAVLLVSEDLDELLELSDRMVVMFEGHVVHETTPANADLRSSAALWPGISDVHVHAERAVCPANAGVEETPSHWRKVVALVEKANGFDAQRPHKTRIAERPFRLKVLRDSLSFGTICPGRRFPKAGQRPLPA